LSALNGDRARFQKNRRRKLRLRQSNRALMTGLRAKAVQVRANADDREASLAMHDEGSPTRAKD
jgi:hypothetical protein